MGSGVVPEKTVQAVAVRPRWTSLRGKKPPVEGGGVEIVWAESARGQRSVAMIWMTRGAGMRRGKVVAIPLRISFTSIRVQPVDGLKQQS
jgi:hypothetical protein